jgi:hypothetical protein
MLKPKYFDRDGKEISQEEWVSLTQNKPYKTIGSFEVLANGERISVSTAWLGTDYDGTQGRLYETMVFGGRNNGLTRFYATELEAMLGHHDVVDIVQDTLY